VARQTFYDILEVGKDANDAQIKAAFRRMAIFYHPDKVKHLGEAEQRRANEKMKTLSEAFAVLRDAEKRKLYDHCLEKNLDFTMEYSRAQSETKEEKQQRAQRSETFVYMLQAAARVVLVNVKGLVENAVWRGEDGDGYYDHVLRGLGGGNRFVIHIRVAEEFSLAEVDKVMAQLDALKPETQSLLIRDHFSAVLVAGRFLDGVEMRERVKRYNSRMIQTKRGDPKRGIVLVRLKAPQPFVPLGDHLEPPFGNMQLKLV